MFRDKGESWQPQLLGNEENRRMCPPGGIHPSESPQSLLMTSGQIPGVPSSKERSVFLVALKTQKGKFLSLKNPLY